MGDRRFALVNLGGRFYALDDRCPHADAPLCDGWIDDGQIRCPWHGATFEIATGVCTGPPARRDLTVYSVRINGRDIEIDV